jgi:rhodanese-related sulfurtransferase
MQKKMLPKKISAKRSLPGWVLWASAGLVIIIAAAVYFVSRTSHKASPAPAPTISITAEISVDDAFVLLGRDSVVFLDVRPAVSWASNHIFQSISIPSTELAGRLNELPHTGTIVIIDLEGGELSQQAFTVLQNAGFSSVTVMKGGMDAWVQRGYPFNGTVPK